MGGREEMRLGISGALLPDDVADLTPEMARTIREWGYTGIFTRLRANDPHQLPVAASQRFVDILADAGIEHVMATGYWQNLIHPDDAERTRAVETLCRALEFAAQLGARCIDTGPGSMNPRGPWTPHPDNWASWAEPNLVKSLKRASEVAATVGVYIHLEGHQFVTLRDAVVMARVIDAVGSPWVRVDMDPVNWITLDSYFRNGDAIDEMFDTLDTRVGSGHSKDITLWDRHTVHLDTVPTGQGEIDHGRYIHRLERLDPEMYLIVEGCSTAEAPGIRQFLADQAAEVGVTIY